MPFAIELFFDAAADGLIRRIWQELAERRIAPHLPESGDAPHISLAVYEQLQIAECEAALQAFAAETPPFQLTLSHLGVFPTAPEAVVFCAPTITPELLDLQARVHELLRSIAQSPWPYYLPGGWVPHCSLAVHFPSQLVIAAIEVCLRLSLPLAVRVEAIGAVEIRPATHLFSHPLRGVADSGVREARE